MVLVFGMFLSSRGVTPAGIFLAVLEEGLLEEAIA